MTNEIWRSENASLDQSSLVLNFVDNMTMGVGFEVLVDGNPASANGVTSGGQEVVAMGASLMTRTAQETELKLSGAFASGTHSVTIELVPTRMDPHPELTLLGGSVDGVALTGIAANIYGGDNYTFDFTGAAPTVPGPISIGSGSSSIDLYLSEDAYLGNAEFTVSVDGAQVGGVYAVTAINSINQSEEFILNGDFTAGSTYEISIDFINDLYGGASTADRNLFLKSAQFGGATISGSNFGLYSSGTQSFSFTDGTATTGSSGGSEGSSGSDVAGSLTYVGVNEGMGPNAPQVGAGVYGTNWTYPTDAEMDYEKSQGMNIIRLGFLDDRVATNASGTLSAAGLALLDPIVDYATSIGLKVILDDHEYGDWFGTELGTGTAASNTADSEYDTFWANLASNFTDNPDVLFGLMNEPNQQTAAQWAGVAQGAIDSIRATGASQEILVSGTNWDGAASWYSSSSDGSTNASALLGITDPDNNMAFEVHSYPDPSGGGTSAATNTTTGVDRLQAVTQWAITNHETLFLGETGGGTSTTSLEAIDNELNYIQANSDVWQGVTEWSAGPWWGNYQYTLEPTELTDTGTTAYNQPQMTQLDTFAPTYTGSPWTI